jgi:hypothetical protein
LYDWQTIPFLPLLIDQLDRGNRDVALPLAQDGFASVMNYRWGMYYSVWCQDEVPLNDPAAIAADQHQYAGLEGFQNLVFRSDPAICTQWGVPAAAPPQTERVRSDIPTLILMGSYDPATPPTWGYEVARTLRHSYTYEFPGIGIMCFWSSSCGQERRSVLSRSRHGTTELCIRRAGRSLPSRPQELAHRGRISAYRALGEGREPLHVALLGSFLVGWVGQIGLLIVTAVRWRRTPSSVRWRRMLGGSQRHPQHHLSCRVGAHAVAHGMQRTRCCSLWDSYVGTAVVVLPCEQHARDQRRDRAHQYSPPRGTVVAAWA